MDGMRRALPLLFSLAALLALPGPGWGQIKPDETLVFIPTAGYRDVAGEGWMVPIHGWVFEPETDSVTRAAFLGLFRNLFGRDWSEEEQGRFRARARMFLVDNEGGKRIRVRIGTGEFAVGVSEPDGHVRATLRVGGETGPTVTKVPVPSLDYAAISPEGETREFPGAVQLLEPTGVSVVSDLDDTIKVSQVGEIKELLANTFLRPFRPVAGMAETYRGWAGAGWGFHYVTASPWQLFPVVEEFLRDQGFPRGSVHMRQVRWIDASVANLFASSSEVKRPAIQELFRTYPQRQFVLVGDSGENDPELYGALSRAHPRQVAGIFIRDVGRGTNPERLDKAFEGIPLSLWRVFEDGRSLAAIAEGLFAGSK